MTLTMTQQGVDTYTTVGDDIPKDVALDQAVLNEDTLYLAKPPKGYPEFTSPTSYIFSVYVPYDVDAGLSLSLSLIAEDWQPSKVTDATKPALIGTPVLTGVLGALSAGDSIDFDATSLMALGLEWRGFGIETLAGDAVIGSFQSRDYAPTQTVSWGSVPPKPTSLSPSGGRGISASAATLRVLDYAVDLADVALTAMEVKWYGSLANAQADTNILSDDELPVSSPDFDMTALVRATAADGHTTNGSPTVTSATGAFATLDEGTAISGTNIPAGARILTRNSSTSVTMTVNATGTATTTVLTVGFALPGFLAHRWWRTRLKSDAGWGEWSDPAETLYDPLGTATCVIDPVDPSSNPLRVWEWSGHTQTAYQLTRAPLADASLFVGDTHKVNSAVTSAYSEYEVRNYDASWVDTLYLWDDHNREDIPGAPAYLTIQGTWSVGEDATVPAPEEVTVTQVDDMAPWPAVRWTYRSQVDFRVRRTANLGDKGKNVSGRLEAEDVLVEVDEEGTYHYQWVDYSAPGYTLLEYRVQAATNNRGSTRSDPVLYNASPGGIFLADPEDGEYVFMVDRNAPSVEMPEIGTTYYSTDGKSARRVVQAQSGYSSDSVSGRFIDIFGKTANEWHESFMKLRKRVGSTLMLAFPRETIPVLIKGATSFTDTQPGGARAVRFGFDQAEDSILAGSDYDTPGEVETFTYDYEEGVDGAAIVADLYGVTHVGGSPKYSAAGKVHGDMGATSGTGGTVGYTFDNRTLADFSVYFDDLTIPVSGNENILKIQDPLTDDMLSLRIHTSDGKIKLFDESGGAALAKTSAGYVAGTRVRIDGVLVWDGTTVYLTVRLFSAGNFETTSYSDQMSGSWPSTEGIGGIVIGSLAVNHKWDTVRVGNAGAWALPEEPAEGLPLFALILPGTQLDTSFVVSTVLQEVATGLPGAPGDLMKVGVSTSADMSGMTLSASATVDSLSIVQHTITGLTADTQYYVQPATVGGVLFGEVAKVKTLKTSGAYTMKIMLGSCQDNGDESPGISLVYQDILDWAPDSNFHLGDWGYWGGNINGTTDGPDKDIDKYRNSTAAKPSYRAAMQAAGLGAVCISDHELYDNGDYNNDTNPNGGHYGDPGAGAFGSPMSERELLAFQALMPIRSSQYGDVRATRKHRGYSYDIGTKVRVIVVDFRSPERSNIGDTDGAGKTMLGATQLAWLLATLSTTRLNILVWESAWLANAATGPSNRDDKPWSYRHEQQTIVDKINATGPYAGGSTYQVAYFGGDRHYVGYLAAGSNTLGGFPCWIGSGWYKNSLTLNAGEVMTWQVGAGRTDSAKTPVCGYMQITLTYDGTNQVTISGKGRAVTDATITASYDAGTDTFDETTWTLTDTAVGSKTWTI